MKYSGKYGFTIMQLLLWGSWATFGQFYTYYLTDKNYNSAQIGTVITIYTVFGLFGQYFWGIISDYCHSVKRSYLLCMILLILCVILFGIFSNNAILVYIIVAGIGFTFVPKEALLDGWLLGTDEINQRDYGKIRAGGSFGFALISSLFGKIINLYGWSVMFFAFISIAMIDLLVVSKMQNNYHKTTHSSNLKPYEVFLNPKYDLLLLFVLIIGIGNSFIYSFQPFIIKAVGGNEVHLGLSAAFAAVIEIPVFVFSSKILRLLKPNKVFLIAAIAYVIRISLTWYATSPGQIIAAAGIQAIGFGLTLSMGRILIDEIAPPTLKTTAQTIFSASFFGVSGIVASILGGYIIEFYGLNSLYVIAELFAGLGLILILLFNLFFKKEKDKNIASAASCLKM